MGEMKCRKRRIRRLHPPQRLFSRSVLANGLTVAFVIVDFSTLYTMWNLYLLESPWLLVLLAGGFAAILDVPMAVAGNACKQARQGLRTRADAGVILILSVLAFLVVFVLAFCFRLQTQELLPGSSQSGGLSSLIGAAEPVVETEVEDPAQLYAALSLGCLPLATSLSAFAVTFMVSDPRQERLLLLRTQRADLQEQIARLEQLLAEAPDYDRLQLQEQLRYEAFLTVIDAQANGLKEQARLLLIRHLRNPEDTLALSERI